MTDDEVAALVREWLAWDRDAATRRDVAALWQRRDMAQLRRLLATRLSFGTAGLRAPMGAGNARINHLTIIQATQGLCAYLRQCYGDDATTLAHDGGVVVGYDARHGSAAFARRVAAVLHAAGIRTLLFRAYAATPLVPFAIRHARLHAGVMVTASHNPKTDNGYKVFWRTGAQLAPPHEAALLACMRAQRRPRETSWQLYDGDVDAHAVVTDAYFAAFAADYTPMGCKRARSNNNNNNNNDNNNDNNDNDAVSHTCSLRFTYTAMHGVGTPFALRALAHVGVVEPHTLVRVHAQTQPDGDFPTVASPNPEEGARVLSLAFAVAQRAQSRHILANDPDADRLGVAEWQRYDTSNNNESNTSASGVWHVFSGNELAALLGWWAVTCARRARGVCPHDPLQRPHRDNNNNDNNKQARVHGCDDALRDCVFLSSAVSSPILATMAAAEGMQHVETLTGFKWMGSAMARMADEDDAAAAAADKNNNNNNKHHYNETLPPRRRRQVLFAFEESIGFMWGERVRDKDGITAAAVVADMTNYCAHAERDRHNNNDNNNKDNDNSDGAGVLWRQLQRVYAVYGYHYTHTSYLLCDDAAKLRALWQHLRGNSNANANATIATGYPAVVAGCAVVAVRDLGTGLDTRNSNNCSNYNNNNNNNNNDNKTRAVTMLPTSPSSPLLTLYFADGRTFALRSSGTEPKLKWYASLVTRDAAAEDAFRRWAAQAAEELLQPDRFGLVRRERDGAAARSACAAKL